MFPHRRNINGLTGSDTTLVDFITSPYPFYKDINGMNIHTLEWRDKVQSVVNEVVSEFYQAPHETRTVKTVLELLYTHWYPISADLFRSNVSYYVLLAKVTDYLLQYLTGTERSLKESESMTAAVDGLEWAFSITVETDQSTKELFSVRKLLLDPSRDMVRLFQYIMLVYSKKVLRKFPSKIEVISLLEGKTYTFYPAEKDLIEGYRYLKALKNVTCSNNCRIDDHYSKTCLSCPFKKQLNS